MRPSFRSLLAAATIAACASGLVTATALATPLGLLEPSGSSASSTSTHAGHASGTATPTTRPVTAVTSSTEGEEQYRQVSAVFSPNGAIARTYDVRVVPNGSKVAVTSSSGNRETVVTLEVSGLLPNHSYGAHAHTKPCGVTGTDAGPHFQYEQDPTQPSTDPRYANDENEIWLDLTTDAKGVGVASTDVSWEFPANRRAHSIVLHEHHTATTQGTAGTAGGRLACVTVNF